MINIPIVIDFDDSQVIGYACIDKNKLPPTTNYHFALGFLIEKYGLLEEKLAITDYDLCRLGLVTNDKFRPL